MIPQTALERAQQTAREFIAAGSNWVYHLPHDAALRRGDAGLVVLLQGLRMYPADESWVIEDGGQVWTVSAYEERRAS